MGSLIGKYMCSLGYIPVVITKREYSLETKKNVRIATLSSVSY